MNVINIKIAKETLRLLTKNDWNKVSIDLISKNLKIGKKKILLITSNKQSLLRNINEYFDYKIDLNINSVDHSTSRDMIFEILMLRFDMLNKHRNSTIKIFKIFKHNPKILISLLPSFIESMIMMAQYANIKTSGLTGTINVKGLLIIYFSTFLTWLKDESSSLDQTMTVLDSYLDKAENIIKLIQTKK